MLAGQKRLFLSLALYGLGALILFERGLHHIGVEKKRLLEERSDLRKRKGVAKKSHEELELVIASQNDPEWTQQTLMRVLGVVPEGYKKLIFLDE